MTTFHFRLESLLKVRQAERQNRTRELAQALQAEAKLIEQREQLARQRETTQQRIRVGSEPGAVNVDRLLEIHRYDLVLRAQEQLALRQKSELREEIARRRSALAEAERQVKVLEKLRERKFDKHRREEQLREQKELDEVSHRTKQREGK